MKKLTHCAAIIFILLTSSVVTAQTDNGGGMGGTGINDKPVPISPAMSEEACTREKSIGVYQLRSTKDQSIKKQGYICSGQHLKTQSTQEIDIHFRSGEKIRLLENSQIVVEKTADQQ